MARKNTTSPSGHHLGIYKLLQCYILSKEETQATPSNTPPDLINQGHDVLCLIFDIMSLAHHHIYTSH